MKAPAPIAVLAPRLPAVSETFVYREVDQLRALQTEVCTFSLYAPDTGALSTEARRHLDAEVVYAAGPARLRDLAQQLIRAPLASLRMLAAAARDVARGKFARRGQRARVPLQALGGLALAGRLRAKRCAHLHIHFAHSSATVGMYAAMAADVPFSVTAHANDIYVEGSLLAEKARRAALFFTIAEANRAHLEQTEGIPGARVRLLRCGVDTSSFRPRGPNHSGPIAAVGRLVAKKGFDVLLRAAAAVPADTREIVLAGDGPEAPALMRLASELGIRDRVQFLGSVDKQQVLALLGRASVFVLPCREAKDGDRDGVPIALMEAMACEVPVISTDVGGVRELVVDGKTGTLVEEGDADELAAALARLHGSPATTARIAAQGRAHVLQEFDAATNARSLLEQVRAVASQKTASQHMRRAAKTA